MAKKNKLHPIKLVVTGVLWSAFYFGIFISALSWLFDFNFLSMTSWLEKYQAFLDYRWKINTGFDFVLFFFMLFWIPLWIIGWRIMYLIKWEKFKPAPRRRVIVKKTFELNENKPLYHMPRKMPATIQVRRYVAPKLPNQVEEVKSGSKSHTNLVQMIRAIATLAKKYKVEIFQHILLEGSRVPMAISTDARAVLIEIVNRKNVNWSVEFTDDVTQSNWYSEGGVMDKLALDLVRASASLAKSEPNSEILSAIIVTDGRVLNTKQAVEYFKSKGIFLIGFNNAEPKSELPDLASFLSAYFDLKEGETDPAPHPVEKIPIKSKQENTEETSDDSTDEQDDIDDGESDDNEIDDENDNIIDDEEDDDDVDMNTDISSVDDVNMQNTSEESVQSTKVRAPMPSSLPPKSTTDE